MVFVIPDSNMQQITLCFCPRLENDTHYNVFVCPRVENGTNDIVLFCPRFENATNYTVFVCPRPKHAVGGHFASVSFLDAHAFALGLVYA